MLTILADHVELAAVGVGYLRVHAHLDRFGQQLLGVLWLLALLFHLIKEGLHVESVQLVSGWVLLAAVFIDVHSIFLVLLSGSCLILRVSGAWGALANYSKLRECSVFVPHEGLLDEIFAAHEIAPTESGLYRDSLLEHALELDSFLESFGDDVENADLVVAQHHYVLCKQLLHSMSVARRESK